jgi:hypothetical protein
VVQELLIHNEHTRYLRARYELPEGGSVLAPLPAGAVPVEGGHFGANRVAYLLDQYHHAQVTEPLLLTAILFRRNTHDPATSALHARAKGRSAP